MASGEAGDAARGTRATARMRRGSKAMWQGPWVAHVGRKRRTARPRGEGPRDNANTRGRPCGEPRVVGYRED